MSKYTIPPDKLGELEEFCYNHSVSVFSIQSLIEDAVNADRAIRLARTPVKPRTLWPPMRSTSPATSSGGKPEREVVYLCEYCGKECGGANGQGCDERG